MMFLKRVTVRLLALSTTLTRSTTLTLGLVALIGLLLVASNTTTGTVQAKGFPPPPPQADANSPTAGPFVCTISYLYVASDGIRVQCTTPVVGTVIYAFSPRIDTGYSQSANQMLALMTTAYALGKSLNVYYSTDTTLNPTGCPASTCRRLDALYLTP
jgi:hypothetical protein